MQTAEQNDKVLLPPHRENMGSFTAKRLHNKAQGKRSATLGNRNSTRLYREAVTQRRIGLCQTLSGFGGIAR